MNPAFSFKVISKGVIINLNPDIEYTKLKKAFLKHVEDATDFFAGVDIYLNLNGREFEVKQLNEITEIVQKYNKIENVYVTGIDKMTKNRSTKKNKSKTYQKFKIYEYYLIFEI